MTIRPALNENLDWNWGVPDWRDEESYFATHYLTDRQWRWEFMRRRPSYRETWLKWFWRRRNYWEKHEADLRTIGLSFHSALRSVPTDDPDGCERKFGMATIADPSRQFSDFDLMQIFSPANVAVQAVTLEISERWSESGLCLFRFDLTRAIRPQLMQAEAHLIQIQKARYGEKNTPKPRRDNWAPYLRALDAKDGGASYDLMRKTFWPDEFDKKTPQSARDVYEAAVRLRENFPV